MFSWLLALFSASLFCTSLGRLDGVPTEDPYEILGVPKLASQGEIRKAFKKLAMVYHPDKKSDQESANKFAAINAAYDIIGNPDKRALYDDFGKSKTGHTGFTSYWEFANSNTKSTTDFYVGDPMITRLNSQIWNERMQGDETIWLVNFYAPWCTHCQQAISMYKNLAGKFDGVIEVGALNCHKDSDFCQNMNVGAYPTFIMYYPKFGFQQQLQMGHGELEAQLMNFVNGRVSEWKYLAENGNLVELNSGNFKELVLENYEDFWAIIFVGGHGLATQRNNNGRLAFMKLSARMRGVGRVGIVDCDVDTKICLAQFPERKLYYLSFPYFRIYSRYAPKLSAEPFNFDMVQLEPAIHIIETVARVTLSGSPSSSGSCKIE